MIKPTLNWVKLPQTKILDPPLRLSNPDKNVPITHISTDKDKIL